MIINHCGYELDVFEERVEIQPTPDEAKRGVKSLVARIYWCQGCRKRLYSKKELFATGETDWMRVKKNIGTFVRRLKRGNESDWVWGCAKEYFNQIKVTVK